MAVVVAVAVVAAVVEVIAVVVLAPVVAAVVEVMAVVVATMVLVLGRAATQIYSTSSITMER